MGIDAICYVNFVRLCLLFLLLALPIDLSVVLWCNISGGAHLSQQTRSDIDPLTLGNIVAGDGRLWAHFCSVVWKTITLLWLLDNVRWLCRFRCSPVLYFWRSSAACPCCAVRYSAAPLSAPRVRGRVRQASKKLYAEQLDSLTTERALLPEARTVLVTDIPPGKQSADPLPPDTPPPGHAPMPRLSQHGNTAALSLFSVCPRRHPPALDAPPRRPFHPPPYPPFPPYPTPYPVGEMFRNVWGPAFAAYTPIPDPLRLAPLHAKRRAPGPFSPRLFCVLLSS